MQISNQHLNRLRKFLENIEADTYPEPPSKMHAKITAEAIAEICKSYIKKGNKILDIGSGCGYALQDFTDRGFNVIGITLGKEDLKACRKRGFDVRHMDQSFLEFEDNSFDLIFARHVLEHSPIPLFTLEEFHRVLKPGKYLYLEMPIPGLPYFHELNKNHYCMHTQPVWAALISRSGFEIGCASTIKVKTSDGIDEKIWFLCKKI